MDKVGYRGGFSSKMSNLIWYKSCQIESFTITRKISILVTSNNSVPYLLIDSRSEQIQNYTPEDLVLVVEDAIRSRMDCLIEEHCPMKIVKIEPHETNIKSRISTSTKYIGRSIFFSFGIQAGQVVQNFSN